MSGTVVGVFKMPAFFLDREVNCPADLNTLQARTPLPY